MATKMASSVQKNVAIQGTLTLQMREANASPTRPRKQTHSSDKVRCLGCWSPNAKHHPCLFCESCLKTMKLMMNSSAPTQQNYQQSLGQHDKSDSFDSQDSDVTAWGKRSNSNRGSSGSSQRNRRSMLRTPRTNEVILNPSLGMDTEPYGTMIAPEQQKGETPRHEATDAESTKKAKARKAALDEKAQQFQKTATRCGFCVATETRRPLVIFCVHCKKHLCDAHSKFHGKMKAFRPHATINMEYGTNSALW